MNLIYLGSSLPDEKNFQFSRMGSRANFASINLQNALLEGLYRFYPKLKIISAYHISYFPRVKKVILKKEKLSFKGSENNYVLVGGINLPILNLLTRFINSRRQLKKDLKELKGNGGKNAVIVYEVHTPYLLAVATLKKRIDKVCLVVPDLPEYMGEKKKHIYKLLKKIDRLLIDYLIRKSVDSFVLLSEPMTERLPIGEKPYTLVEGIFNDTCPENFVTKEDNKVIMYTGSVDSHNGIITLMEAFGNIKDEDFRLWIRGDGNFKDEILSMAKADPRIVYMDPMSREKLLELEKKATILVNPTLPSAPFAKFFFPSKTMEYLASGTPIVMFRLVCMPDEYDPFIYYVEGEDSNDLAKKIIEVCGKNKDNLREFGRKARNFVLERKNPYTQCKKIAELLE